MKPESQKLSGFMFKISEMMCNMRQMVQFKHKMTIIKHLFEIYGIYLQHKKILMVKVYG